MSEPEVRLHLDFKCPPASDDPHTEKAIPSPKTSESNEDIDSPSDESNYQDFNCNCDAEKIFGNVEVPIVSYEVLEERAKFTMFKLKVDNKSSDDCWFVFRRYTDFVKLHSRLKIEYPSLHLSLPRKKWFGDNFKPTFLEERIQGLQDFINSLLRIKELATSKAVIEFFSLDQPPVYEDRAQESQATIEALEEKNILLKRKLKEKELEHEKLKIAHSLEIETKLRLASFLQDATKECPSCALRLSQIGVTQN